MINRELIEQYFADRENGLPNLISLFEVIIAQRDRTEFLNLANLHQIKKLHEAFSNITEPKTGKKISEIPVRTMNTPTPKSTSAPKLKTKETLDLGLDLDFDQ